MEINVIKRFYEKDGIRSRLEYPLTGIERLDSFYSRFAEAFLRDGESTVISVRQTLSSGGIFSLFFDVKRYRGGELVYYKRFSDTKTDDGMCILPEEVFVSPKKVKSRYSLASVNDFYLDGKGVAVFRNLFSEGDGKGLRHSMEERFVEVDYLSEEEILGFARRLK